MSDPVNPYAAYAPPRAELDTTAPRGARGSIEDAVAGNYDFTFSEITGEAWRLTRGYKGVFWATSIIGTMIAGAVAVATSVVQGVLVAMEQVVLGAIAGFVGQIVYSGAMFAAIYLPVTAISLGHIDGERVTMKTVFDYSGKLKVVVIAGLLYTLLSALGMLLLIIPGIYLSVAWTMAVPLLYEHDLSAGQAMTISRKAVHHKWWTVFAVFLVAGLVNMFGVLTLFILHIWTIPWMALCYAVIYRRMFGGGVSASGAAPATSPT